MWKSCHLCLGCSKVPQTLEHQQINLLKLFSSKHLLLFHHLTSFLCRLCTCLPPISPPFSSVYLFQSWWSSCQTCSCLMMMGTYSIRPAENTKLEGQKEGFIGDGRPSCYRHANRNGSAVPGVLPPDNVPSYSALCMNGTDQTHYVTVLPLRKSHSKKKSCFSLTGTYRNASTSWSDFTR